MPSALVVCFTGAPRKEVYFMAVIDILQHYDAKKKAAHAAKTVKHGVRDLCGFLSPALLQLRFVFVRVRHVDVDLVL